MIDGYFRAPVEKGIDPLGRMLHRIGVTADIVTAMGMVMSTAAAVAIGRGNLWLGVILLALTGVPDALDGAVAKAAGTSSVRGAYFDSVADRVSDAVIFLGLAWHLTDNPGGHMGMLPVAIMGSASMISYQRAKAESQGFDAKGGLMERAERFFMIGIGLILAQLFSHAWLVNTLWLMLVLVTITALQRFVKVWRQADKPVPVAPVKRRRPADIQQRRQLWKQRVDRRREESRRR